MLWDSDEMPVNTFAFAKDYHWMLIKDTVKRDITDLQLELKVCRRMNVKNSSVSTPSKLI